MKNYLIPQRLPNEPFEDYKLRRAIGNIYSKQTNRGRDDMKFRALMEAWGWRKNAHKG